MNIFWIFTLCFILTKMEMSYSKELKYIMRSPEALLMGDAYTTLADDDFTLFYNPALLAKHKGVSLYPVNAQATFTNPIGEENRIKNFPNDPVTISDRLMGFPLHFGAGIAPGFKLMQFALQGIVNMNANLMLRNATHPTTEIDYRRDQGFTTGGALKLWSNAESFISFGYAFKYIKRTSIDQSLPLYGSRMLNILQSDPKNFQDVIDQLDSKVGKGIGHDAGLHASFKSGPSRFNLGAVAQDIGSTSMSGGVPSQPMNVATGASWQLNLGLADVALSSDLHQVTQGIETQRKLHLGAKLGLPLINVFTGINAGYLSYGASVNLGIMKIIAGFYDVEVGESYHQTKSKRGIVAINLFNFSFDP